MTFRYLIIGVKCTGYSSVDSFRKIVNIRAFCRYLEGLSFGEQNFKQKYKGGGRSQWPCGLRHKSEAV
jgi:hypothetical protein